MNMKQGKTKLKTKLKRTLQRVVQPANFVLIKRCLFGCKAVIWCVVRSHKVREFCCQVQLCTNQRRIYRLAVYAHNVACLDQTTTNTCLGPQLFSQISSAILNHTKNVSDNIAVVRYALKFSSYVSKYTVYAKMAYRKETAMRVWRRTSPFVSCIQL